MKEGGHLRGVGGRCDATSEPSLLLFYKVSSIMWPQQVIYAIGKVNKTLGGMLLPATECGLLSLAI